MLSYKYVCTYVCMYVCKRKQGCVNPLTIYGYRKVLYMYTCTCSTVNVGQLVRKSYFVRSKTSVGHTLYHKYYIYVFTYCTQVHMYVLTNVSTVHSFVQRRMPYRQSNCVVAHTRTRSFPAHADVHVCTEMMILRNLHSSELDTACERDKEGSTKRLRLIKLRFTVSKIQVSNYNVLRYQRKLTLHSNLVPTSCTTYMYNMHTVKPDPPRYGHTPYSGQLTKHGLLSPWK